jgi:hypothetical protein
VDKLRLFFELEFIFLFLQHGMKTLQGICVSPTGHISMILLAAIAAQSVHIFMQWTFY